METIYFWQFPDPEYQTQLWGLGQIGQEEYMISELCASERDMNLGFFCPIYRELRSSSNSIALGKAVHYLISHLCADIWKVRWSG